MAVGGVEDHVHILLSLPATMAVAKAVRLLKSGSSLWVHQTFPAQRDFAWQEGYGAFSLGVLQLEQTKHYIECQPTITARRPSRIVPGVLEETRNGLGRALSLGVRRRFSRPSGTHDTIRETSDPSTAMLHGDVLGYFSRPSGTKRAPQTDQLT